MSSTSAVETSIHAVSAELIQITSSAVGSRMIVSLQSGRLTSKPTHGPTRPNSMHALLLVGLLSSIDSATAARAFAELRTMCEADAGRIWGRSLCGPIVFADPRTREAITESGPATIPDSIGIANTAVDWEGRRWTMEMLPLPASTIGR